jgi:multiple sugar transport system substrate-binding protein
MKKLPLVVVLAVMAVLAGIAVAQYTGPRVTLTYWHGFTGPDKPVMDELIKAFNDSHANIEVRAQAIPWGTLFQQLAPSVAAGRAADVAAINEDQITGFIARGALQEITPEMMRSAGLDQGRFYESLWKVAEYQGRSYGVPVHSVALVMYYNKALFRRAGLDPERPPRNRQEFLETMLRLTVDRAGRNASQPGFDPSTTDQWGTVMPTPWMGGTIYYSILLQNGGRLVSEDTTRAVFNTPEAVEALQFMVDLVRKHKISPSDGNEDGSITAFRQGKSAVVFNGVWLLSTLQRQADLEFGMAAFPRLGTREDAAWGGSSHLVLPRQRTPDPNRTLAAMTFINWITSPAQNLKWTSAGGLPTQPAVASDPSYRGNPMLPVFASLDKVQATSGYPWVGQVRGALDAAVSDALLGRKTPQQALDDGVREANAQIEQARRQLGL